MEMVIVGVVILGALIVIIVSAWCSVFREARGGDPVCPRCRARLRLFRSCADARLTLRCKQCDRGDPTWYAKAMGWAKSRLHPPR